MTGIVHGEVAGLVWFEIPREAVGWAKGSLPEDVEVVTVVGPRLPSDHLQNLIATKPSGISIASANSAFRPFDPAEALPGRTVMWAYHDITDEAVTEWARAHAGVPAELDLSFRINHQHATMSVAARTLRDGRPTDVRRKLRSDVPLPQALAEHLPYFLRNCPRVPDGLATETCAAHVVEILAHATRRGVRMAIEDWLAGRRAGGGDADKLTIPGDMLPGSRTEVVTLAYDGASGTLRTTIRMEGWHTLEDDDKGATEISLNADLPQAVLTALPRRTLDEVIDVDWARRLMVRVARPPRQGERRATLRCAAGYVPLALPDPDPDGLTSAAQIASDATRWQEVQETVLEPLSRLDHVQLADFLTILHVRGTATLDRWGMPGWQLRTRGGEIVVDACPQVAAGRLFAGRTVS